MLEGFHERKNRNDLSTIRPLLNAEQIASYRDRVREIHIEPNLIRYVAQIVSQTRNNASVYLGASPRASIAIMSSAKAYAAIQGRDFVTPEDIKAMVLPVLRHRLMLTAEREMEGISTDEVLKQIVDKVEVPR